MKLAFIPLFALFAFTLAACGDDDVTPPADGGTDARVPDAGRDGGPPTTIEEIPAEETLELPCMTGEVSAVQDDRGMWHIYATTLEDAMCAEGYLMARDRFGQMEFIRRSATGRLAEVGGDDYLDDDLDSRFAGHRRNAEAILATLPAEQRALLDAFSAGITEYIVGVRTGELQLPSGVREVFATLAMIGLVLDDWTPADTLAIARLQSAQLSYDPGDDISMTDALAGYTAAFPATSSDPVLAARAEGFHDFYPFAPSRDAYTRDGFPNVDTDTGSRALVPPRARPRPALRMPSRAQLRAARAYADRTEASFQRYFGDETRGSNSWVVHGSHTASGNPLLANDPHLGLSSPPLFWMVHLNTMRAGGDVDVQGLALAGTPIVLLGYNESVAWGLTTHGFDVTDLYLEEITEGGAGAPDTVRISGMDVPIQISTETIGLPGGKVHTAEFEYVEPPGGFGPPRFIIPETRTPTSGISVRWTGNEPSNEAQAFFQLATARNVDDVRDAYESFGVGGQNLVAITRDGNIFWSTQVKLPVRDARAFTYDPATRTGVAPCFVMPGTGEYEWTGYLSDRYLPHDLDPASGFIATANNDGVGVTADGNPFDASHYIGWNFNDGHRQARIVERLEALTTAGGVTAADLSALQGDSLSPIGRLTRDALVAELLRAEAEAATPGTHPDLTDVVTGAGAAGVGRLAMARMRLEAWTFETPPAVEGTPTAAEIADSVAASLFNAAIGRLLDAAIGDEMEAIGDNSRFRMRTLLSMLNTPEDMLTYDAGLADSILWDDITTTETESRGHHVVSAFLAGLAFLETELETATMDEWRWGLLHTLTLASIIPSEALDIPPPRDPMFPNGFPRHGDNDVVDASGYGLGTATSFDYGSGPQQRLVVEMTPDGPIAVNALPGGQAQDLDSPHFDDEIELWRVNRADPMYFVEPDVVSHHERRVVFLGAP